MTPYGQTAAIFGCEGATLGRAEASFFAESQPFGFILFARNVENPKQLKYLTTSLRDCVGRDVPIFVDQEGGRVQRLRAPHWREWPAPLDFVQSAGPNAARAMALRYRLIARELLDVGITGNCAPTADVIIPTTHPFLRNRCYSSDPKMVAEISLAVARSLMAEGVWPVVKHLPGHGRSENDTHHDLPKVTAEAETLQDSDFVPFKALAELPFAMTAHIVFSAFDSRPATQSPTMIRIIREEIGFKGLLMTDDLNMKALTGSLYDRTVLSMAAGCDLALHCNGDLAEMQSVAKAAGSLRSDSLRKASNVLSMAPIGDHLDTDALDAELKSLLI